MKLEKMKLSIKKFIYKYLTPKSIKNSLTNPYFLSFSKLTDNQRKEKLKKLNKTQRFIVIQYVSIFLKLRVFFNIENLLQELEKDKLKAIKK